MGKCNGERDEGGASGSDASFGAASSKQPQPRDAASMLAARCRRPSKLRVGSLFASNVLLPMHSLRMCRMQPSRHFSSSSSDIAQAAVEHVHKVGDFAAAGLVNSLLPTDLVRAAIEQLHCSAGLSWCASVALMAVALKLLTLPLNVMSMRNAQRLAPRQREIVQLTGEMRDLQRVGDAAAATERSQRIRAVYAEIGASPLTPLWLATAPLPAYIAVFVAMRGITTAALPALVTGGTLWFANLNAPDPLLLLPALCSAATFANVAMNQSNAALNRTQTTLVRLLALSSFPFIAAMPSLISFYFFTLNGLTFVQNVALKQRRVRKWLGLTLVEAQRHSPAAEANAFSTAFPQQLLSTRLPSAADVDFAHLRRLHAAHTVPKRKQESGT